MTALTIVIMAILLTLSLLHIMSMRHQLVVMAQAVDQNVECALSMNEQMEELRNECAMHDTVGVKAIRDRQSAVREREAALTCMTEMGNTILPMVEGELSLISAMESEWNGVYTRLDEDELVCLDEDIEELAILKDRLSDDGDYDRARVRTQYMAKLYWMVTMGIDRGNKVVS
jgi:hypothetical protein